MKLSGIPCGRKCFAHCSREVETAGPKDMWKKEEITKAFANPIAPDGTLGRVKSRWSEAVAELRSPVPLTATCAVKANRGPSCVAL